MSLFIPLCTILSFSMTIPSVLPVFALIGLIKKPPFAKYCLPNKANRLLSLSLRVANLVSIKVRKGVKV